MVRTAVGVGIPFACGTIGIHVVTGLAGIMTGITSIGGQRGIIQVFTTDFAIGGIAAAACTNACIVSDSELCIAYGCIGAGTAIAGSHGCTVEMIIAAVGDGITFTCGTIGIKVVSAAAGIMAGIAFVID